MTDPHRPPEPHHAHCRELFARLSEYLDRELDEIQCREIEGHLNACPPCQACFETLERTVALCRQMPSRPVSGDFARRLREAVARMGAAAGAGRTS